MISAIGCQKAHREWRAHSRRAAQGQHRRDGRPIKPAPRATPAILRVSQLDFRPPGRSGSGNPHSLHSKEETHIQVQGALFRVRSQAVE